MSATADGNVFADAVLTAQLGPMVAAATGAVTPQPTAVSGGSDYPRPRRPQPKPKPRPRPQIEETPVAAVAVVEAFTAPLVVSLKASATAAVTFSAEDDDLQVLLML